MTNYNVQKTNIAIIKRSSCNKSFELELKNGVTVLVVDNSTSYESAWFLYIGCELVIGDVTSYQVARAICDIAQDTKDNLCREFGLGYLPEFA
jgi:hypothetical protein